MSSKESSSAGGSASRDGSPGLRRRVLILSGFGAVVALVCGLLLWRRQPPEQAPVVTADPKPHPVLDFSQPDPLEEGIRAINPGYVGPDECVECHADRVAEFRQTAHFQTCREPDPDRMPAGFAEGKGRFKTQVKGLEFDMIRSGDQYFQTAIRQTESGEQRTKTRIDLVYGAGTADEIYFAWHDDDRMYELPVAWLYTHKQWAAEYFDPFGSGDYSRPLTLRCLECHNTWFEYVPGSLNQYRRDDFIIGITCERCHGPAQQHVQFHREHPDDTTAHAITNPAELSRERQIEICTQCHGNTMKHLGPALSYRPGEPLDQTYKTLVSRRPDEDHVANQIQYLRESRCFQGADGMTCSTCHDSHRPRDATNSGVVSCLTCHSASDCGEHDLLPEPVRNDCVNCHMPARIKINVNFQTEDDLFVAVLRRHEHQIRVDETARDEVLWEWLRQQTDPDSVTEASRLKDSLVQHWLNTAGEFQQQKRHFAAIASVREALRVEDSREIRERLNELLDIQSKIYADWDLANHQISEQQYDDAIATLQRLVKAQPQHGPAIGKLGTMYAVTGRKDLAIEQLEAVETADPNDPYGQAMLGWLAYLDGQAEQALLHYENAQKIEPYNPKLDYQAGLALMSLGKIPEAVHRFRSSFEIDPGNAATCQSMSMALAEHGEIDEAILFARRAVRLTESRDMTMLMLLGEVCARAEDFDAAVAAGEQARAVARDSAPGALAGIHRELAGWKSKLKAGNRGPSASRSPSDKESGSATP
ncbi:MAG: tetratricopeptide repeat protein [Planctomycetaceae bacterium]